MAAILSQPQCFDFITTKESTVTPYAYTINILYDSPHYSAALGPLLLTWFNFNPSMDK